MAVVMVVVVVVLVVMMMIVFFDSDSVAVVDYDGVVDDSDADNVVVAKVYDYNDARFMITATCTMMMMMIVMATTLASSSLPRWILLI